MKNKKFRLIDKQDRKKLSEGTNKGMGFAFAKIEDSKIVTVDPISPCKDYLNDRCYTEWTGKPFSAHGLHTTKQDIFKDKRGYLVMSICKEGCRTLSEYSNYKRDFEMLDSNYENLQKFLNWFEKELKIKEKTEIIRLEENKILAILPLFWTRATYRISLYSLLCRIGYFYKEGNPKDFLDSFNQTSNDIYLMKSAMPKLIKMLDGIIPEQDMNNLGSYVHNSGIVTWNFPNKTTPTNSKPITEIAGMKMVKIS